MFWLFIAILVAFGVMLLLAAMASRRRRLPDTAIARHRALFARALSEARRRHAERALEHGLASKIVLRPLRLEDKERCRREWSDIESRFSTDPARAVVEASRLCEEIARLRGREQIAIETSARRIAYRGKRGKASLEELQAALDQYRAIIDDLLADGERAA